MANFMNELPNITINTNIYKVDDCVWYEKINNEPCKIRNNYSDALEPLLELTYCIASSLHDDDKNNHNYKKTLEQKQDYNNIHDICFGLIYDNQFERDPNVHFHSIFQLIHTSCFVDYFGKEYDDFNEAETLAFLESAYAMEFYD